MANDRTAMVARIASEMSRADAAATTSFTDIALREISSAIKFYQRHRFYFNEKRTITFATIAGQSDYDSATSVTSTPSGVTLAHLLDLNAVTITQSSMVYRVMKEADPEVMEELIGSSGALTGVPYKFSYFGQVMRLYPIPNDAYTIRVRAHIRWPEPASDAEASNPWMIDAEELIRCRAKRNIFLHSFEDMENAQIMQTAEKEAFEALKRESNMRQAVDRFEPSEV